MLIISKKKDYYDGVVGTTGIDKTIVYDRKMSDIESKDVTFPKVFKQAKDYWKNTNSYRNLNNYSFNEKYKKKYDYYNYFIVFFCDKIYIGWEFVKENIGYEITNTKYITYDIIEVKKRLKTEASKFYNENFDDSVNSILNKSMMELHREYNSPTLVFDMNATSERYRMSRDRPIFRINPVLKSYEFYKVFDTFSAFQEIQMFIGGVLTNPEENMIELSNDVRIKKHGFDKFSFRKEPKNKK